MNFEKLEERHEILIAEYLALFGEWNELHEIDDEEPYFKIIKYNNTTVDNFVINTKYYIKRSDLLVDINFVGKSRIDGCPIFKLNNENICYDTAGKQDNESTNRTLNRLFGGAYITDEYNSFELDITIENYLSVVVNINDNIINYNVRNKYLTLKSKLLSIKDELDIIGTGMQLYQISEEIKRQKSGIILP